MRCVGSLFAAVLWLGCASPVAESSTAAVAPERIAGLERELAALAPLAPPEEGRLLAVAAVRQSQQLAADYRLTRPPVLHNLLVNLGLRERGLCWHWTEDLIERLGALPLPSYALHWGIAHRGERFREHNSLIVTARGGHLASGLVLDPWRESGELHWVAVADDSYPWEPY
ncbi:MAG: hypothetical protein ACE5FL_02845 [Myxococcota bacterium]